MEHEPMVLQKIIHTIRRAHEERLTGRLIFNGKRQQSVQWLVDFHEGNLVWSNREYHRHRRFIRSVQQREPKMLDEHWGEKIYPFIVRGGLFEDYWELNILDICRREGIIKISQIEMILQMYFLEMLITLSNCERVDEQVITDVNIPETLFMPSFSEEIKLAKKWQEQRHLLSQKYSESLTQQFSFDLFPTITDSDRLKAQVNPVVFENLTRLLTGKHSFWDISGLVGQNWISVASVLLPLLQAHCIEMQEITDIDLKAYRQPTKAKAKTPSPPAVKQRGVIACIDDSPVIAKEIERILSPHGYEILSVIDPLKGLATLIKAKPRLIFLDLVMPNTNGYEVCTFLRKSSQFDGVPIVMLTGHDGIVDRLRAKMVGSDDFLGKPPNALKVIQVLQKHLGEQAISSTVQLQSLTTN